MSRQILTVGGGRSGAFSTIGAALSRAEPGASLPSPDTILSVADFPVMPSSDTSTSSAGNSDSTP